MRTRRSTLVLLPLALVACTFDAIGLGTEGATTGSSTGEEPTGTATTSASATTSPTTTTLSTGESSGSGVDPSATATTTTDPTATTTPPTTGESTTTASTTDGTTSTTDPTTGTTTGTTGTTSGTTTGGDEGLVDEGLIVRYYLDEAEKMPPSAVDAAPMPLDLPVTYSMEGGENPVFGGGGDHRGMEWPAAGLDGRATIPVAGTKVQNRLVSKTAATIEFVADVKNVHMNGSRFVHIGAGSQPGYLTLRSSDTMKAHAYWQGDVLAGAWDIDWDAENRIVVHLVFDSMEADAEDRVRFYVDGVERDDASDMVTDPTLAQQIAIPDVSGGNPVHFTLGNRGVDVDRSFEGTLHYAAVYNVALDADQIAQNVAVLSASDDSP